jgi:Prokaryotic metallothionein
MADKNCAHSGCTCKVQEDRAISRGSQVYCSVIARMPIRRAGPETAVAATRTAGDDRKTICDREVSAEVLT